MKLRGSGFQNMCRLWGCGFFVPARAQLLQLRTMQLTEAESDEVAPHLLPDIRAAWKEYLLEAVLPHELVQMRKF